jgi:hypothetical protein
MEITQHEAVINALSHRAGNLIVNASVDSAQHAWAIDEKGTLETPRLDICNEPDIVDQKIREVNAIALPEEVFQIHGYAPPKKSEGTVWLVYETINGFNN